jgi:thymidylate synthase (FAD)
MEIIKPRFVIEDEVDGVKILKNIERYGRTCYKSEDRITSDSARKFVATILKSGHESVIEHEKVTVRVVCDRGVTHEIVRHRIASYSQESTRYCNYLTRGIQVIEPLFFLGEGNEGKYRIWHEAMEACERAYNALIEAGGSPQEGAERSAKFFKNGGRHNLQSSRMAALFPSSRREAGPSPDAGNYHTAFAGIPTTHPHSF